MYKILDSETGCGKGKTENEYVLGVGLELMGFTGYTSSPSLKADICGRQSPPFLWRFLRAGLIPAGQDWPSDLRGLCSVSGISGFKSFQRMQVAAAPLPLLVAAQTIFFI